MSDHQVLHNIASSSSFFDFARIFSLFSLVFRTFNFRSLRNLRTFARKFSNIDFFLQILPLKDDELVMSEM